MNSQVPRSNAFLNFGSSQVGVFVVCCFVLPIGTTANVTSITYTLPAKIFFCSPCESVTNKKALLFATSNKMDTGGNV